jgi:hypothetical protein
MAFSVFRLEHEESDRYFLALVFRTSPHENRRRVFGLPQVQPHEKEGGKKTTHGRTIENKKERLSLFRCEKN